MDKIKVLMVDDEERFRKTTKAILVKKGFDTIMAEDGNQAIQMLDESPDVVILDIRMPGMDGHQALEEIKQRKPDLPVIMLTGHGAEASAREALSHGAFDYLTKPCDIDLLTARILDACQQPDEARPEKEKRVMGVMVPFQEYTTINENSLIREAVARLKESFVSRLSTSRIMETGHRSVLVLDDSEKVIGVLTIIGLLQAVMPAYLSAPKPSTANEIEYSPMFWQGMFTRSLHQLGGAKVSDIMSPTPKTIDGQASLMEAAYMMIKNRVRRLLVTHDGDVIGVIREQDLFFEMEKILRK